MSSTSILKPTRRALRGGAVWLVMAGLLIVVLVPVSVVLGDASVGFQQVWDAYFHFDRQVTAQLLVRNVRVPRTIIALIVGAGLGASGVVIQALTRNPLAEPGLLGVNAGATFAVACGVVFFGFHALTAGLVFGFVGAGLAGAAVYLLGGVRQGAGPVRLVLAGSALSVVLLAATRMIIINSDEEVFDRFRSWTVGSLEERGPDLLLPTGIAVVVMLMCGASTAAVGPIGFVGLTAPHLGRQIVGLNHRKLIPASALIAAAIVLAADVAGRLVVSSGEISVGIMIGFIGAPVFINIVRRRKLAQL